MSFPYQFPEVVVVIIVIIEVNSDHRSKFSNLSNWKWEAWKNQGFNGIRTRDFRDTGIAEVTGLNPVEAMLLEKHCYWKNTPKYKSLLSLN